MKKLWFIFYDTWCGYKNQKFIFFQGFSIWYSSNTNAKRINSKYGDRKIIDASQTNIYTAEGGGGGIYYISSMEEGEIIE